MAINPVMKTAAIVVTVILTMCSAVLCYLDLDGSVEVKSAPGHMLKMEDMLRPQGYGNRGNWNHINGIGGAGGEDGEMQGGEIGGEDAGSAGNEDGTDADNGGNEGGNHAGETDPDLPQWEASGEYDMSVDILALVNKENPVDENYVPADLVKLDYCAADRSPEWQVMTREAADAFNKMAGDALAEGHEIVVTTAYRSYNFQSYFITAMWKEKDKPRPILSARSRERASTRRDWQRMCRRLP